MIKWFFALVLGFGAIGASASTVQNIFVQGPIEITDARIVQSRPNAPTAAAHFMVKNLAATDDRITGARVEFAKRAELHESVVDANGVASMNHLMDGIALPAGEMVTLKPGGLHVMFMGVQDLAAGQKHVLILEFEKAQEMRLDIPVIGASAAHAGHGDHSDHNHSDHNHGDDNHGDEGHSDHNHSDHDHGQDDDHSDH